MSIVTKSVSLEQRLENFCKQLIVLRRELSETISNETRKAVAKASNEGINNTISVTLPARNQVLREIDNKIFQIIERAILNDYDSLTDNDLNKLIEEYNNFWNRELKIAEGGARAYCASKQIANSKSLEDRAKQEIFSILNIGRDKISNLVYDHRNRTQRDSAATKESKAGDRIWQVIWQVIRLVLALIIGYYLGKIF